MANRSPYFKKDGSPELQHSVVAFIDILGYKSLVQDANRTGTAQALLARLHGALFEASRGLHALDEEGNPLVPESLLPWKARSKIRSFTDNIVIGYPIRDDAESELRAIFSQLSFFQIAMVNRGFFLRGAISIGDLYIDDLTVFGQGLIDAYDGESESARDPRIVLTKSAEAAVKQHVQYYSDPESSPQARELYKDADGQFFLNYLESILVAEAEHGPHFDELARHKSAVEAKLSEHLGQPEYWAKYAWSALYHNFFCDQYSYFSDEQKIDVSQFHMHPARIV